MSIVGPKQSSIGRNGLAREQAQNPLEKRRRCGQRLARHSELGLGREHGALRLGFGRRRHAARAGRLHRRGADAAGDLADRRDPDGARAVEHARHHHEVARCRRLRRRLPDDQHAGRMRGVHPELPLRAARPPLVRPDPRRDVWRLRLLEVRQRDDPHHRDDRDAAGARQSRRDPEGRRPRLDLRRPLGPRPLARLPAGPGPDDTESRRSDQVHRRPGEGSQDPGRHPLRRAVMGARDDRPRLSARHHRQRQLADDGGRARGHRRNARGCRRAGAEAGEPCTRQRGAKAALLPRPPWSAIRIERSRRAEPRPRPKCVRSGSR